MGHLGAVYMEGEEDPRSRNKFSFGLYAEMSVGVVPKRRRKLK